MDHCGILWALDWSVNKHYYIVTKYVHQWSHKMLPRFRWQSGGSSDVLLDLLLGHQEPLGLSFRYLVGWFATCCMDMTLKVIFVSYLRFNRRILFAFNREETPSRS